MSSVYQPKRKELAKVKVVSTEIYKNKRSKYLLVGSVSRNHTNFVTTQRNVKTGKCTFIDDTSSLTKRSKNDLVKFFSDKNNRKKDVAYLVVDRTPKKRKKVGK